MLKQIDKRGNLLVKIRCDTCGWLKWMKPRQVPKYHNCPQCIVNLNEVLMTPEEVKEVKKELKETIKNPQEVEVTIEEMVERTSMDLKTS